MSKKEFYETYIKDNKTEDEKMMDIIHSNARKGKDDKYIQENSNNQKKGIKMLSRVAIFEDLLIIFLLMVLVIMIWTK